MAQLDKFHYHEALDRAYCVNLMIEEMLTFHPVIAANKDIKIELDKAISALSNVYNIIGNESDKLFD